LIYLPVTVSLNAQQINTGRERTDHKFFFFQGGKLFRHRNARRKKGIIDEGAKPNAGFTPCSLVKP